MPTKSSSNAGETRPTALNSELAHKLVAYAVAGAAGAGVLAQAKPSQAEIVYTPANQTISEGQSFALDLNNDGIADLIFSNLFEHFSAARYPGHRNPSDTFSQNFGTLNVIPQTQDRVLVNGSAYVGAFPTGRKVGPGELWKASPAGMLHCTSGSVFGGGGPWHDKKGSYVGIAFSIKGKIHYGWARLSVSQTGCDITAVLTGYAYETAANKPIITGATSGPGEVGAVDDRLPNMSSPSPGLPTLGLLAKGCLGLDAWRRDQDAN